MAANGRERERGGGAEWVAQKEWRCVQEEHRFEQAYKYITYNIFIADRVVALVHRPVCQL